MAAPSAASRAGRRRAPRPSATNATHGGVDRALHHHRGTAGLALTRTLTVDAHAIRFVTRHEGFRKDIETAGGECYIGDPDRVGSLRYGLDNVTVLLVYEGTPGGAAEVARMAEYNEIPHAILDADREDEDAWVAAVLAAIDGVLAAPRGRQAH